MTNHSTPDIYGQDLLTHALKYAQRGLHVFPLVPGTKKPALESWPDLATIDETTVRLWWGEGGHYQYHGIGVATGRGSDLVGIDVDIKEGKRGDETLADLEDQFGQLPLTPQVVTRTGGLHYYFKHPNFPVANKSGSFGEGIDVRGHNGFLVAPPTVIGGATYEWEVSAHIDDVEMAEAPDWLLDLLRERPQEPYQERPRGPGAGQDDPGVAFAAQHTWQELLEANGARCLKAGRANKGYEMWQRPGKSGPDGSASLGWGGGRDQNGDPVLKVFTDAWPGLEQGRTYTKFGFYVAVTVGNPDDPENLKTAAKTLLSQGYGTAKGPKAVQEENDFIADLASSPPSPSPAQEDPTLYEDEKKERPVMREDAFIGVVGRIANLVGDHANIDKSAYLVALLTAAGVAIGRERYLDIAGSVNPGALYTMIAGLSGRGRKSTAIRMAMDAVSEAEKDGGKFYVHNNAPGSGEAFIDVLSGKWRPEGDLLGSDDSEAKRTLLHLDEAAALFSMGKRMGNTMPQLLRTAFDQDTITSLARSSGLVSVEKGTYHLGVISSITFDELKRELPDKDVRSGSANRFLYIYSDAGTQRSVFRSGNDYPQEVREEVVTLLKHALTQAHRINAVGGNKLIAGAMELTEEAKDLWDEFIAQVNEEQDRIGVAAELMRRGEVIALRLAVIYSCLDLDATTAKIDHSHLKAALAVWDYHRQTVEYVWGSSVEKQFLTEDAKRLLKCMQEFYKKFGNSPGATRTEQMRFFGNNWKKARIDAARDELVEQGFCTENAGTGKIKYFVMTPLGVHWRV